MPIYEYVCTACDHRADIFHGLHDPGPTFCPSCGAEGTMRKAFVAPTIVFKGSGWAKKDRQATSSPKSSRSDAKTDRKSDKSGAESTAGDHSRSGDHSDPGGHATGSEKPASTPRSGDD